MKASILLLAALGSVASAAQAQSSVTLYGFIDAGISYVNNSKTATGGSFQSDGRIVVMDLK